MNESDLEIVIAGETGAGKSTLVNKILQKNLFIANPVASTSTICKIRNLEKVKIIAKRKDGKIYRRDLSEECDMSSEAGEENLRTVLSELTDLYVSGDSIDFEYVDVGFPIPFLKGNAILVDTPGIGGSGEVSQKVMDYLPSAISFIFVINVGCTGGFQSDMLQKSLRSLNELLIKNEMPWLDPQDVIFITNKWDHIRSSFNVEKIKEIVWEKINIEIKRHWPSVQKKNIFRMNLNDVNSDSDIGNTSTEEFKKFQKVLLSNFEKANNKRIERHASETKKKQVIAIYRELERFLQSEAYGNDLEQELEKANPGFKNSIQKRIQDMNESDHGIVIAGETSAGKTTLINKILQKNIFIGFSLESTSTICKIRNLETVKIITKSENGKVDRIDLSEKCDMNEESGVKFLQEKLAKLTNRTVSEDSIQYDTVDVGFPIPFLKGNTILVDTPGIGGSGDFTHKLIDYLPSAVSFIFVINAGNAGGLPVDRLPIIMNKLCEMKMKDEMPCFDPENVIFVTNKWDTIRSSSNDNKEKELVWEDINIKLKKYWPCVKKKHIFRMNILDVNSDTDNKNTSTEEFKQFQDVLLSNIEKAKNIRIERHVRFLEDLLTNVSKGLTARVQLRKMTADEQQMLANHQLQELKQLKTKCDQMYKYQKEKTNEAIEDKANECLTYMRSENGKNKILNPHGKPNIIDVGWQALGKEIEKRMTMHIETFLRSQGVSELFQDIAKGNMIFYEKTSKYLSAMEAKWTAQEGIKRVANKSSEEFTIPSFLEIPISVLQFVLIVVVGVVCIALSPILLPVLAVFMTSATLKVFKGKHIENVYRSHMMSIEKEIHNHLKEVCGNALNLLSDKIYKKALANQMQHLQNMIQNLQKSREEILLKTESFIDFLDNLEIMKASLKG